jgi:hypothetical protein
MQVVTVAWTSLSYGEKSNVNAFELPKGQIEINISEKGDSSIVILNSNG